ncbi:hypothetical protein [Brevundimonas sp.]|jgi:hypothetical protein|uniref:hypothetical protein n=1 Tax=Brevundimonas sp. TaxID=1871086 RepID=UPI00378317A4
MVNSSLRTLRDLPGVDDLELKSLMKPRFADPDVPEGRDEIDALSIAIFGLALDEAESTVRPADWDGIETLAPADMAEAFEAEGWDVTDKRRKPLRLLPHLALPLALAMRGVAGELPFHAEPAQEKSDWGSSLAADAKRFTKR